MKEQTNLVILDEKKSRKIQKMSFKNRKSYISKKIGLHKQDFGQLHLKEEKADKMIENCIGCINQPLGFLMDFRVNDKSYHVPLLTRNKNLVKNLQKSIHFFNKKNIKVFTEQTRNIMRGQIFIKNYQRGDVAQKLDDVKQSIIDYANNYICCSMYKRGGGLLDIQLKESNDMLTIFLLIDVQDSMGANTINTILEGLAPKFLDIYKGKVILSILSNLAPERISKSTFEIPLKFFSKNKKTALEFVKKLIAINKLGHFDLMMASTLNKKIMEAIFAVAISLGQDTRAIEAGMHSYNFLNKKSYTPYSSYEYDEKREVLKGSFEMPFVIGTKGGAMGSNKMYKFCFKILDEPNT